MKAPPSAEDAEDDKVFTFGSGREGESTLSKLTLAGRPKRTKGKQLHIHMQNLRFKSSTLNGRRRVFVLGEEH